MHAVHDLSLRVAHDEGFFRDKGLHVEILRTPGSGHCSSDLGALHDDVFKRTLEGSYEDDSAISFRCTSGAS